MPFYEQVYEWVRQVPPGKVVTYGQVAALLGSPRSARAVGYALRYLPRGTDVPWQRVINHRGEISPALPRREPRSSNGCCWSRRAWSSTRTTGLT